MRLIFHSIWIKIFFENVKKYIYFTRIFSTEKTMRGVIRVCGAAGLGMNSTADIIADIFAELGYLVNTDIEYQSLIKGWVNYFDIFFSDESKYISKYHDVLLALDTPNLKHSLPFLKKWGILITNSKNIAKLEAQGQVFSDYQVLSLDIEDKYDNTYLISILGKLLNFESTLLDKKIEKIFAKKWPEAVAHNQGIRKNIYESYELSVRSPFPQIIQIWPAKALTYWNKVLADGATASELEYYSAYPMTPASTILSEIIKWKKVQYLQAEDEISVVMSALGASFAGKRSMVGTSGGGFALMVEGISFAIQSEIPLVMVLSQRAGPSTWTPTFHEQGDLNLALNPSFWDFEHIVITPSSLEDGYYLAWEALNLAQKYQTIVILLTDKQYADGKATLAEIPQAARVNRGKLEMSPAKDFKRYELSSDGISPYTIPGTLDGDFIATSYEHDEYGATTEETDMKKAMTEKRWKKLENFYEKEGIRGYEVFSSSQDTSLNSLLSGEMKQQKVIITTSYTSYTAKEFIKNNPEFGLIIIKYLKPLDRRIRDELVWKSEVIFVESNYSGQLEKYITQELWLAYVDGLKISNLRKYDLYPFYYEDFESLLYTQKINSNKDNNNYVYIDAQNLYIQIQNLGWKIDYKKFYVYLTEKYQAKKIYYFIGFLSENEKLYEFLKNIWYIIIHREVVAGKWNVDAEMIFQIMKDISVFDSATLITSDWDFSVVIQELLSRNKLQKLMIPDKRKYSYLLRNVCWKHKRNKIVFMNNLEKKLKYK